MTRDHEDRDAIRERASEDMLGLYEALGGRRRGRALHCISPQHEDRTLSASIRRGRYRCFGCGLSVDAAGAQSCVRCAPVFAVWRRGKL